MLWIGKRPRKGPFNSIVDPTEFGAGSVLMEISEAVKKSGTYDAWEEGDVEEEDLDGMESVRRKKVKVSSFLRYNFRFAHGLIIYWLAADTFTSSRCYRSSSSFGTAPRNVIQPHG